MWCILPVVGEEVVVCVVYFTCGGGEGCGLGFCLTMRIIFVGCRDGSSFTSRDPGRTWIFGRTILICLTYKMIS